ncbi:hypothetical protein JS541_05335 [Bifidobacterium sp. SO1]|nr:hypothetical protein [Bifidobacterium sp. SO1]
MKTWSDLCDEAADLGVAVRDRRLPAGQCGEYDPDLRIAYIDPSMSEEQRVCTLQHELIHAQHSDDGLMKLLSSEKEERLTRRETALALIDSFEYANVERIYEGEPYAMAEALGVTYAVLIDYQTWLHDTVLL